jgi:hypothetical protein
MITEKTIDLNILVDFNKSIKISEINNGDSIISWNGNQFVKSIFDTILPIEDEAYEILAGDKKITISKLQSFWTETGKIKPSDVIENQTEVYLKNGQNLVKVKVKSITKLEGTHLLYSLFNSSNHNYIVNDFLLHNFDLYDFVGSAIIGVGNIKKEMNQSTNWDDMYNVAKSTWNAYEQSVFQLFNEIIKYNIRWDDTSTKTIWETYITDFITKYQDSYTKREIFWNSVIPTSLQRTGIYSFSMKSYVPLVLNNDDPLLTSTQFCELDDTLININYDLTGTDTFTNSYWFDFNDSLKEMTASIKRFLALTTGFYSGENDYSGTIPPSGFTTPSY